MKQIAIEIPSILKLLWQLSTDILLSNQTSLIGPASWHICQCITTSSSEDHRTVILHDSLQNSTVSFAAQSKPAESIPNQGVSSTLDKNTVGHKGLQNSLKNALEYKIISLISAALLKRNINLKVGAQSSSIFLDLASPRIEILDLIILMKRQSKNSIGVLKGLLDSIPMMDVYVYIEDSIESGKEILNTVDDIIDVAEAGRLVLLGMMESSHPVYNFVVFIVQY